MLFLFLAAGLFAWAWSLRAVYRAGIKTGNLEAADRVDAVLMKLDPVDKCATRSLVTLEIARIRRRALFDSSTSKRVRRRR